jgi:DNA-binding transcriptional LysR family regulator
MNIYPSMTTLRCFDAVARYLSITKAGAAMHLTQSAVSHHILSLEKQLGIELFVRHRRGLELTSAGRTYWDNIAPLVSRIGRVTESLIVSRGVEKSFNLSVSSTFGNFWLMPRLHHFVTAYPSITLNLSTRVGPVDFAHSEDDASIEFCEGEDSRTHARLILQSIQRPYISPALLSQEQIDALINGDQKELIKVLSQFPLIRRVTVSEAWPAWIKSADITEEDVSRAHLMAGPRYSLVSMAMSGCIAGLGIALLPEFIAKSAVHENKLLCLSAVPWVSDRAYYLRWPIDRTEPEAVKVFSGWLETQVETKN